MLLITGFWVDTAVWVGGTAIFRKLKEGKKSQTASDLTGMEAGLEMKLVTTAEVALVVVSLVGRRNGDLGKFPKFNLTT
jgi:hypothetical protein